MLANPLWVIAASKRKRTSRECKNAMKIVKDGDFVQAKDLTIAAELSGQYGRVIMTRCEDGKVGVLFGAVSSIPKLISESDLVVVDKIPFGMSGPNENL